MELQLKDGTWWKPTKFMGGHLMCTKVGAGEMEFAARMIAIDEVEDRREFLAAARAVCPEFDITMWPQLTD